jgi:hypothetical protein
MPELTQSARLARPANRRPWQRRETLPTQGAQTDESGAGKIVAFRRKSLPGAAEKNFHSTIEHGDHTRAVLARERAPAEVYGVNRPGLRVAIARIAQPGLIRRQHVRRTCLVSTANPGRIA